MVADLGFGGFRIVGWVKVIGYGYGVYAMAYGCGLWREERSFNL